MSTPSSPQSRDRILETFHEITQLNYDDCIQFLNQYNWNLQDITNAFYNGKDFKNKSTPNLNAKVDENKFQLPYTHDPNFGNFYGKNDRKQQANESDDHYYAKLLQRYGDSDESARNYSTQGHDPQYHHYQQAQQQRYQQLQQQYSQQSQEQPYQQLQQQYHQPPQQQQQPPGNGRNAPIYHEKQEFLRCGIHSLNNLFQIPNLFTHNHLDSIVHEFDKRHVNNDYGQLSVGDYDIRILIEAIHRVGYQVRQINFLNREPLQTLPWDSYFGLLINLNGAHWFTIKNLNGIYHNLDSTFKNPHQSDKKMR